MIQDWHVSAATTTWSRVESRLKPLFKNDKARLSALKDRFMANGPRLISSMHAIYGWAFDFYYHLEQILLMAAESLAKRPADLVTLDAQRERSPNWFEDHKAIGGVVYVDRFAGSLAGIARQIPYFKSLGLTYLHLMPLFDVPAGENDGGYAVSDYRKVNPALGSMEELASLAGELRKAGISLVLDFILNHTSDEHPWAMAAKAGDIERQAYYWMFDDRRIPDRYQPSLRAIFPDRGGDSFTFRPDVPGPQGGKWVWTTFYTFQWDLNYRNPALMTAIAGELLFLANQGVEVLRLDAVPFLWKELGTNCENRQEAHTVVEILNAVAALAAPALVFKSEAIVHPDDVVRFVSKEECRLSYNPLAMALSWEALATSEVRMLKDALHRRHALPGGTSWVTYLRCHDDIGWGFADEDAVRLGIDPGAHRNFLNVFYTGRFAGSFASGLPFQENPVTGDCRICGTLASLAGLEKAIAAGDGHQIKLAVRRILMLNGLILTMGGVPLIYLGDEIAQLNDYGYRDEPAHAADARWVHRPRFPADRLATAEAGTNTPEGVVLHEMRKMITMRKNTPALGDGALAVVDVPDPHILAFTRENAGKRVLVLMNFKDTARDIPGWPIFSTLGSDKATDLVDASRWQAAERVTIEAYGFHCFEAEAR